MSWEERIQIDPRVLVGKPVVKGTRLAVEFLIDLLANGWSEQQIIDNYPGITADDLHACLHYAVQILKSQRVYLTPQYPFSISRRRSSLASSARRSEFSRQ